MRKITVILLWSLILLGGSFTFAQPKICSATITTQCTFNVSAYSQANSLGSGTTAAPWSGWEGAVNNLGEGVKIYFPAGIYSQTQSINVKRGWYIYGAGKEAAIIKCNIVIPVTSSIVNNVKVYQADHKSAFKSSFPRKASTASNIVIRDLQLLDVTLEPIPFSDDPNTTSTIRGAALEDVGGTYVHYSNLKINGFKFGIVFDETEISTIEKCDFINQRSGDYYYNAYDCPLEYDASGNRKGDCTLIGENKCTRNWHKHTRNSGAGIWLANGKENNLLTDLRVASYNPYTITDQGYYCNDRITNVINISSCTFNETTDALCVVDEGGYGHTFEDCIFTGGKFNTFFAGLDYLNLRKNTFSIIQDTRAAIRFEGYGYYTTTDNQYDHLQAGTAQSHGGGPIEALLVENTFNLTLGQGLYATRGIINSGVGKLSLLRNHFKLARRTDNRTGFYIKDTNGNYIYVQWTNGINDTNNTNGIFMADNDVLSGSETNSQIMEHIGSSFGAPTWITPNYIVAESGTLYTNTTTPPEPIPPTLEVRRPNQTGVSYNPSTIPSTYSIPSMNWDNTAPTIIANQTLCGRTGCTAVVTGLGTKTDPYVGWEPLFNSIRASNIYFPAGYYRQGYEISLREGQRVFGDGKNSSPADFAQGTVIMSNFVGSQFRISGVGSRGGITRLSDLTLTNNTFTDSNTGTGITITDSSNVEILNIGILRHSIGIDIATSTQVRVDRSEIVTINIGISNINPIKSTNTPTDLIVTRSQFNNIASGIIIRGGGGYIIQDNNWNGASMVGASLSGTNLSRVLYNSFEGATLDITNQPDGDNQTVIVQGNLMSAAVANILNCRAKNLTITNNVLNAANIRVVIDENLQRDSLVMVNNTLTPHTDPALVAADFIYKFSSSFDKSKLGKYLLLNHTNTSLIETSSLPNNFPVIQ